MVELKLHKQKGAASHCAATKSRVRQALRLLYPATNENVQKRVYLLCTNVCMKYKKALQSVYCIE